jgi:hypothetical protein
VPGGITWGILPFEMKYERGQNFFSKDVTYLKLNNKIILNLNLSAVLKIV